MNNFRYKNPVEIVFGKGEIGRLPELIAAYVVPKTEGAGKPRILVTYGGGSIQRNGVYDQVKAGLAGCEVFEFGGIEPNPQYSTLMKAVELVRAHNIDLILAVGGGSVLDGTKFIAAAARWNDGDPWDGILEKNRPVVDAVPLASVITLPATGSEMNGLAVISKKEEDKKMAFFSPAVFPKFSIIDPETTFSLPKQQTVNGIVDTFVHVAEQYITHPKDAVLQDRQSEAILLALIETAPRVLAHPNDYGARANLFWMATQALNGWINVGTVQCWATHGIGHELTALTGTDHGQTLALVLPAVWKHQRKEKGKKIAQLGRRVFGLIGDDTEKIIDETIAQTKAFFASVGMNATRSEYGITDEVISAAAKMIGSRGGKLGDRANIGEKEIVEILNLCD